ncbi:LOW QUALITY PROTEIN: hypothetical protein HID58_047433 [Brassica napus]|uniref:Uncharacterized protein n=1 Tax=Brassica napus TaxID=3708 RepID=A0ABQ8B0Q0_BRANA|nr:LOW QUALITY PROTEIN: hypothetical protein HID58_047433 [Brassica napus]
MALVVGVWEQVGQCGWLFLEDPTERKYEVVVHENQTYTSLMDLVRTRYSVGLGTAVTLTYEFPDWMKAPGDISTPPVDVKEDGDVELFMPIQTDLPSTRLMVTIGNEVVARYLFQRCDDYTVIGSSKGVLGTNDRAYRGKGDDNLDAQILSENFCRGGLPEGMGFWEGMLGQCVLTASQQFLTNVFSCEDVTMGNKDAFGIMGDGPTMETIGVSETSTDSSPGPVDPVPALYEGGIIRLTYGAELSPTVPNKMLIKYSGTTCNEEGKPKVCKEDEDDRKRSYASGRLSPLMSNPNFPDPIPDADTTDEDTEDKGEKHLFVGQVFIDRSAFKTHMSLYALANKFRFLCCRPEPGKLVLVCRGGGGECQHLSFGGIPSSKSRDWMRDTTALWMNGATSSGMLLQALLEKWLATSLAVGR